MSYVDVYKTRDSAERFIKAVLDAALYEAPLGIDGDKLKLILLATKALDNLNDEKVIEIANKLHLLSYGFILFSPSGLGSGTEGIT